MVVPLLGGPLTARRKWGLAELTVLTLVTVRQFGSHVRMIVRPRGNVLIRVILF